MDILVLLEPTPEILIYERFLTNNLRTPFFIWGDVEHLRQVRYSTHTHSKLLTKYTYGNQISGVFSGIVVTLSRSKYTSH